jgi:L-amino acid N-acyltransferase YncA
MLDNILKVVAPATPARAALVMAVLDRTDFRVATKDDASELAALFAVFFEEARYRDRGIVYSRERALRWLEGVLANGKCPHVVATVDNKIVGACSYSFDDTFCVEPVAVLHTVYVLREHRRSVIGRMLVVLACDMAKNDGAVAFHAPLASGMVESVTLANLFVHAGFDEIGKIMGRRL